MKVNLNTSLFLKSSIANQYVCDEGFNTWLFRNSKLYCADLKQLKKMLNFKIIFVWANKIFKL